MKTIGLIGGTTWLSTVEYYRNINRLTNERLGGLSSAKILLYSLNFEEFKPPADPAGWGAVTEMLTGIAQRLENAGAECLLLCANTPHMAADDVQKRISIPLINIAVETARVIRKKGIRKVGLLGTKFTMELPFFKQKLASDGIETLIPNDAERDYIHNSIYAELGKGIFTTETKKRYLQIIASLEANGAGGVILGCTEIPLLIQQSDCTLPVFDTTLIHSAAAVDFSLASSMP